jgi:hypothetical protein
VTPLATHRESTGVIESERNTAHFGHGTFSTSTLVCYGFSLTREELRASYVIIRYNIRTYRSAGVVEVVKGKQLAESTLQKFEGCQDSTDHYEGWRYLIDKSDLKPGTDPTEATLLRQQELEMRESRAMQETESSALPHDSSK